ncbi:MAG: response regulator [Proteobacteria bacterium]|jgi:CheY-like chemotaxis protein|nr:response regulator [Pseudomonadota bacterium]
MNVMYVDDESDILDLAQMFFKDHGIDIDTFTSPVEALQMAAQKNYSVILSDARMPEMSGFDFYAKLRGDLGFKGRFMLVSGHYDYSDSAQALEGIDGIILKPVEFDHLLSLIKNLELDR